MMIVVNIWELPGNGRSDLIEWLFDNISINEIDYRDIVSETTGLDTYTGIILEPTVEFFTFLIDSVMSVFSAVMNGERMEFVMVGKNKIGTLADQGEVGATFTISDMEPYKTVSGSLDFLRYPNFSYSSEDLFVGDIDLVDVNFIDSSNNNEGWLNVRRVISQWYQILRMIAIIGLLSVLIYTGIKIIISSNAKDKAKYKELIVNWLVGVILVFAMHYIMAFILAIIEEITALLKGFKGGIQVNAGGVSFVTNLIGLARFQMQQQHFTAKVGHLIIYTALVVYTFKFTFLYFKRVFKMAFLTLVAPIVALTYPIDKANDGKAQGFEMWLKEFVFNALLQPVHYILYYILVSSALQLAAKNPLYGIVALAFMSQAETLLKQIFGFNKAKVGNTGGIAQAFTTGAITSSLINHVSNPLHPFSGGKGGKKSSSSKKGSDNYYNEEYINFYDDTLDEDELLNMNLREENNTRDSSRNSQNNRPTNYHQWNPDNTSREEMLEILGRYQEYGGNLDDIGDLNALNNEQLIDLIQDRVIDNGGSIRDNIFMPMDAQEVIWQPQSEWARFKEQHPSAGGVANVMKKLVKPIWDVEKDAKYNGTKIATNVVKGITGTTVGVGVAAVQTGISLTDGKVKPIEPVTSVAAGIAGVSAITEKIQNNNKKIKPEDKEAVRKYSEQWFNRDDIISKYNQVYAGEGKKRRERAARNYVTRGITDVNDQKQAMNFADLIQNERGLGEEEADKIAVATLQYRQGLVRNNSYNILFDKKQKEKYLNVKLDTYSGSASLDAIRRLHDDLIENVRDFDRANK